MLDVMLNSLDHNDGIVDDDTDREDETEERERVHCEAKEREESECADERYGHGQQWNDRRAPPLKKDEYDQDDQPQGFKKSVLDLDHTLRHCERGIERDDVVEVRREALGQFLHLLLRSLRRSKRIRAWELVKGNDRGRLAVEPAGDRVVLRAEFDACHILHPQHRAVGIWSDDDLSKLLRALQTPLRTHRIRKFLSFRHWLTANGPGRVHRVL